MPSEHRVLQDGLPLNFSCSNWRFQTDVNRGARHGWSETRGSIFESPLVGAQGEYSLWLEHVLDRNEPEAGDIYWFMWYGPDGQPTIPASSIFSHNQLVEMVRRLLALTEPNPTGSHPEHGS